MTTEPTTQAGRTCLCPYCENRMDLSDSMSYCHHCRMDRVEARNATGLERAVRDLLAAWPNIVNHPRLDNVEIATLRAALAVEPNESGASDGVLPTALPLTPTLCAECGKPYDGDPLTNRPCSHLRAVGCGPECADCGRPEDQHMVGIRGAQHRYVPYSPFDLDAMPDEEG